MSKKLLTMLFVGALLAPMAAHATPFTLAGNIYCEGTGLFLPGVKIEVTGLGFTGSDVSDATGFYEITLPEAGGDFVATAILGADETVIFPPSGAVAFTTSLNDPYLVKNWVVATPNCSKPEGMCWMTGGGAKISVITDTPLGEVNRRHNFGGNVYPGCSPTAGQGGQWNHIDDTAKLHFQAFSAVVERCGNVDGIPPGSESPVTPFNFIEWTGVGRVQGIKGNKVKYEPVYCFSRVEDRNEPGSSGQRDGSKKDRYFLHVYTNPLDPAGSTLILVDGDGNPGTVDPLQITDGNLQLHISSCEDASVSQLPSSDRLGRTEAQARLQTSNEFWFATSPNPVVDLARIKFGMARDGRVSFNVFDVSGRLVRTIGDATMAAGQHSIDWNLQDASGSRVSRGMYFIQMKADGLVRTQRVVIN